MKKKKQHKTLHAKLPQNPVFNSKAIPCVTRNCSVATFCTGCFNSIAKIIKIKGKKGSSIFVFRKQLELGLINILLRVV